VTRSLFAIVLISILDASPARGADPFGWGIGIGEIPRDTALTSIKWEFIAEPNLSAEWVISAFPAFDSTDTFAGHDMRFSAHRGIDSVDFDGFGRALGTPLFRSVLTLDDVFIRSDYESLLPTVPNDIQIDSIEMTIHYNRSDAGVWSFWPSFFLNGTATYIVPEPTTFAMLAVACIAIISHRRKSVSQLPRQVTHLQA
jgi:hypothetical protein